MTKIHPCEDESEEFNTNSIKEEGKIISVETKYKVKCPFCKTRNKICVDDVDGTIQTKNKCNHLVFLGRSDIEKGKFIFKTRLEQKTTDCPFCDTEVAIEHHEGEIKHIYPNSCKHVQISTKNTDMVVFSKANTHAKSDEIPAFNLDESKPIESEYMRIK